MRRGFTLIELIVIIAIIVLLLCLTISPVFIATGLYHLLAGWVLYLQRTLPEVQPKSAGIITFLVAMFALLCLLHSFCRWLSRSRSDSAAQPTWRWPWTIKCLALVLLAFAAGICAVGMVHQVGWLASSKELIVKETYTKFREAANEMLSSSNLRQCVLAMHNYHSDYKQLPPVFSTSKEGKPLLSWRVLMLPYLEHGELYKKFKLDEPWDSPHNLAVLENNPMPQVFELPGWREAGWREGDSKKTYYRAFYSKPEAIKAAGLTYGSLITLGTIADQDGTANTAVLIEGSPVFWTKPEDIEYHQDKPLPEVVSFWRAKTVQLAMFDGSIRTIQQAITQEELKALVTRNGGER